MDVREENEILKLAWEANLAINAGTHTTEKKLVQHYARHLLNLDCGKTGLKRLTALRPASDPTFFPEIFPVEKWKGTESSIVIPRAFSDEEVPDRAREQEALAALSAAKISRRSGNAKKTSRSLSMLSP
ncbi:hypothetical protein KIN20_004574 [Parelaphostrongylus tenuis]|uniref:Uncharacterized protein n=1 Tax=Parelaphostrongylus tenuis TaxID=148309 RepID=A0AAD5QEJ5_PARTN|nr:hypothetical protein KIN20_004574 [Parelaphostrongylus tenuis]